LRARFNAERQAAQSFAPVNTGVPQNSQLMPAAPAAGLPAMSIAPIVLELKSSRYYDIVIGAAKARRPSTAGRGPVDR
jgi:hypothetical protein